MIQKTKLKLLIKNIMKEYLYLGFIILLFLIVGIWYNLFIIVNQVTCKGELSYYSYMVICLIFLWIIGIILPKK